MANTEIPVGNYDLIRLYISSTEMVLKNGDSFTYNMNQNGYSGNGIMQNGMLLNSNNKSVDITLNNPLTISEGGMSEFLLDMDVDQSFMLEGVNFTGTGANRMMSMSGFTFMPTMRFVDLLNTGTINGTVQNATDNLANATISLMQNGSVYTTTHSDAQGNYAFIGIPDGDYTMTIELDAYMLDTTGNELNMNVVTMTQHGTMSINFKMVSAN